DRSLGHEVDDVDREFNRVVRMDEMPGLKVNLQDRPVAGIGHARHERRDDITSEVRQSVERGLRDERLLVTEGEEDRRLDLGEPLVKVLRIVLLYLRPDRVAIVHED